MKATEKRGRARYNAGALLKKGALPPCILRV